MAESLRAKTDRK